MDSAVLPYHWDNRDQLHTDYLYLRQLYEDALPSVALALNAFHGVDHSQRYWRIVIGPWLSYFIQILFDRWQSIRAAADRADLGHSITLDIRPEHMVPQDMAEFTEMLLADRWNHFIYSEILRVTGVGPLRPLSENGVAPVPAPRRRSLPLRARRLLKETLSLIASTLGRQDFFFIDSGIYPQGEIEKELGQWPTFWASPDLATTAPDWSRRRHWALPIDGGSAFERFLWSMIPSQLPVAYVEGHHELVHRTDRCAWPNDPKLIVTASSHYSSEFFKTWAAGKVEKGAKLVINQHGGHFGIGRWVSNEDHELAVADRYFSWGWSRPESAKVVPLPSSKLLKATEQLGSDPAGNLLMVLASIPRYSYWMYSLPVAGQMLCYLEDQFRFARSLPCEIRKMLAMRLYRHDLGWDVEQRVRAALPDVKLDPSSRTMYDSARRCRLFVATYNATTFLETFAGNVPTVMFWNPRHWELRPQAQPHFDRLRDVGLLHDTPESAAGKVAAIWDDVPTWWAQPDVQEARRAVCDTYARTSPDWRPLWRNALVDLAHAPSVPT